MNPPATNLKAKYLYFNRQYRHWLQSSHLDSTTLITTLAGFILACFLTWSLMGHQQQQQSDLIDTYGSTLNKVATNQLKVLMSNNNLIGLQSALNDLIDQTRVVNAVVYGVDNKIIVQAGDTNRLYSIPYKAYTAPITLDDGLLGSLTININNDNANNVWPALMLLALIASLLLLLLRRITKNKVAPTEAPIQNDIAIADEEVQDSTPAIPLEPNHQALLLIRFHTLDKLYQQLNAEARQRELEKIQHATKKLLTLYSGKQIAATPDTLLICFEGKDKKGCLLNALYYAYLLLQTSKQQQWLMAFSSFIYNKEDCEGIDDFNQLKSLYKEYDKNLIAIKNKTIDENSLNDQLTFNSTPACDYIQVTGFSESYEELLKKQLTHLN